MKLQLGELRLMVDALPIVINAKGLSFTMAYKLSRVLQILRTELEPFEQARWLLVNKFAKKDADDKPVLIGNQYDIPDQDGFNEEWVEMASEEVEIDFKPVPLSAFEGIEIEDTGGRSTLDIVLGLGRLIDEEDLIEAESVKPLSVVSSED